MNTQRRKAFSYVRLSTTQQLQGDSLSRQTIASDQYAKAHGLDLVERLEDIGLSAFDGKHVQKGAMGKFREAINSGHIPKGSVLLIESLDRLSRQDVLSAFEQFTEILKAGISIVTLDTQTEYTEESLSRDIGKLMMSLGIMFRANEESEIKSHRLKAAWKSKRSLATTKKLTAIAPAWLELDKDRMRFIPIDLSVVAVQKIFTLSIQGYGAGAIVTYLSENVGSYPPLSIRNRVGKTKGLNDPPRWHKSYIQKILGNPAVYGEYQPHVIKNGKRIPEGDSIPDYFPEIISKDDFRLSRSGMAGRRVSGSGRKGPTFSNLFTRLAVCASCGATIGFQNKGKPPKGGRYLRCTNAVAHHNCEAPAWRYEHFEQSFLKWISEVGFDEIINPNSLAKQRSDLKDRRSILEQEIEEHDQIYRNLRDRLGKVPDTAVDDVLADIEKWKSKIDESEREKDQIESELLVLTERDPAQTQQDLIDHINDLQASLSEAKKKDLRIRLHNQIREVVETITVHNSEQFFASDDAKEIVPEPLLKRLKDKGMSSKGPKNLDDFFSSGSGKQLFHQYQRHFAVKFKNGTVKLVYPDQERAMMIVGVRMAQFIKNVTPNKPQKSKSDPGQC